MWPTTFYLSSLTFSLVFHNYTWPFHLKSSDNQPCTSQVAFWSSHYQSQDFRQPLTPLEVCEQNAGASQIATVWSCWGEEWGKLSFLWSKTWYQSQTIETESGTALSSVFIVAYRFMTCLWRIQGCRLQWTFILKLGSVIDSMK